MDIQTWWYQRSQLSHAVPLWPHFTALLHTWQGYLVLGPGFNSAWPPNMSNKVNCFRSLVSMRSGQVVCLRK
jgi:hypothetical protein